MGKYKNNCENLYTFNLAIFFMKKIQLFYFVRIRDHLSSGTCVDISSLLGINYFLVYRIICFPKSVKVAVMIIQWLQHYLRCWLHEIMHFENTLPKLQTSVNRIAPPFGAAAARNCSVPKAATRDVANFLSVGTWLMCLTMHQRSLDRAGKTFRQLDPAIPCSSAWHSKSAWMSVRHTAEQLWLGLTELSPFARMSEWSLNIQAPRLKPLLLLPRNRRSEGQQQKKAHTKLLCKFPMIL